AHQSSSFTVNGRVTSSSVTLVYVITVTPHREGEITLPPVRVVVDGEAFTTAPATITVTDSDPGDYLVVDIEPARPFVYLGEPVEYVMTLAVRPNAEGPTLPPDEMLQTVISSSDLGLFAAAFSRDRQHPIGFREVTRRGADDTPLRYYEYDIRATEWPKQAGPTDFGDVVIRMEYPLVVGRRSGGLLIPRGYDVKRARPIVLRTPVPPVDVRLPPDEGRPANFTGAVGRFTISASATPTEVAVGDPVELTLNITDRGSTDGHLDTLEAPPLGLVDALVAGFRVPTSPLAGRAQGDRKTFTAIIRPRRADLTEIPAIPFAYFDPVHETYETAWTKPIPLTVAGSTTMMIDDVVTGSNRGRDHAGGADELTAVAAGILANDTGPALLVEGSRTTVPWWFWIALVAPPLAFVGGVSRAAVRRRSAANVDAARRRSARRRAHGALRDADAAAIGQIVRRYVGDRSGLPGDTLTTADVVSHARARAIDEETVTALADLLATCDASVYGGTAIDAAPDLAARARSIIDRLERERLG
ncbi:MAG: BatD family protein, partial [Phycisphaerales bacterium]|nr:BatD family protein [Phycisphaerales bacterium]